MPLGAGAHLGPYEILSAIGAGGMGEVYRARDTKLKRDVALKILPESFAADPDRLARFHREAEVLASLNHPHIAAIYGFEDSGETHALVMELVDGETLADRIARGPIPIDEALPIAKQIAEALEAAHEQGIVHRDLKPANIKVTQDGNVKVLDFGLAKLADAATVGSVPTQASPLLSLSPTITSPALMTNVGVLLGTAAYMAPEQAKGRPADKRSDVWAFGCVLFEMLTGKRAFDGEDVSDTIAAVLRGAPDWTALPHNLSPRIRNLLARCLEKDRRNRIADTAIALFVIEEEFSGISGPVAAATSSPRASAWKRTIPFLATAALTAAVAGAVGWTLKPSSFSAIVTRFAMMLPDGQRFTNAGRQIVAISPDGERMVYVANGQLYLRSMSGAEPKPIPGTNIPPGVLNPVFSPDSQSIAFWSAADSTIKRISIAGGSAVTVCSADRPFGMTWTESGILFGEGPHGLLRVAANGGKPEVLVKVGNDEVADGPQLLPDGETVLFTLATGSSAERWERAKIVVRSLRSGAQKTVIEGGSDGLYLPSGHVVYALGGTLFAVPFDVKRLDVTGSAVPVVEGISRADTPGQQTGIAHFSVSSNGSLMYVEGPTTAVARQRDVVRVDRKGGTARLKLPSGPYEYPRVSPDGKRLALGADDGKEASIWIYDLSGASAMRRLTFGGNNRYPIWSADGERIAYQSDREGDLGIFWQRADGTGTAERLTRPEKSAAHVPEAWMPSGERLLVSTSGNGEVDGSYLSTFSTKDGKLEPFGGVEYRGTVRPPAAVFSPDGRWVAYASYDSGRYAIDLQPFPPTGAKYQVDGNGNFPRWSADELFFARGDQLFVVMVSTQPPFSFSNSAVVPGVTFPTSNGLNPSREFDVAPDGTIVSVVDATQASFRAPTEPRINVVLNWFEEVKRLAPANLAR